jgi:hypothetical protein
MMARFPRRLALLALVTILPAAGIDLVAQAGRGSPPDPLLGTWRLDVTKSRYSPGPPIKGERRIYTQDEKGIHGRIEREHADGRREVIDYRAEYDHEVPVTGAPAYDAIRFKRVDPWTTEGVLSHAGRVFGVSRRVIARDGSTMTITFRREEPGDMVNNFAVYTREK